MTIKEVEKQLGVSRTTIRFYEKEELFVPQRGGNTYREYSADDIATLKKIIILRKLGFKVAEIKDFLEENVPLQELIEKNIQELQEKMNELNGAMKVCKQMQSRQENFDTFNEDFYWNEIKEKEKEGNKFLEIMNDSIYFEKEFIKSYLHLSTLKDKKKVVIRFLCISIYLALFNFILNGLGGRWSFEVFLQGLVQPFIVLLFGTILGIPLVLLSKWASKRRKNKSTPHHK